MGKHSRSPSDDDEDSPSRGAKRRPPPCAHSSTPSPPWADLPYGPAGVIAERALANDVSDYVTFRAVCRAWRRGTEAAPQPQAHAHAHGRLADRRFYPHRWIMLREAAPPGHRRRFLNVSTGQCVQTELPELEGHHLLGATTEGLLALLHESTYVVRLLNPATRQLAELPTLDPLLSPETRAMISKCNLAHALKVTGLGLVGDDCTLAIFFFAPKVMLVVARPGDGHWTLVEVGLDWFHSAMSFSGRFYCATGSAVMALELVATTATTNQVPAAPRLAVVANIMCTMVGGDTVHLVESDGRLMLLHRSWLNCREGVPAVDNWRYKAYEVDLAKRETVPIYGLRGRAVFLGETRALSVSPLVFPSIRGNKVYPATHFGENSEGTILFGCDDRTILSVLGNDRMMMMMMMMMAGQDHVISMPIFPGTSLADATTLKKYSLDRTNLVHLINVFHS